METKDFIIEIIINKLNVNDKNVYDKNKINVEIVFDDIKFDITSSRINVDEFREGRSIGLSAKINELVEKLRKNPYIVTIVYSNEDGTKRILGELKYDWPESLFQKLQEDHFSQHTHINQSDITHNGVTVGDITLVIMLLCKCPENKERLIQSVAIDEHGRLKIFKDLGTLIDPNDVLFLIGDTPEQKKAKLKQNILNSKCETGCLAELDIGKYRIHQGKLINDCNVIEPCEDITCCETKNHRETCNEDKICDDLIQKICQKREENRKRNRSRPQCSNIFDDISISGTESNKSYNGADPNAEFTAENYKKLCEKMRKPSQICFCCLCKLLALKEIVLPNETSKKCERQKLKRFRKYSKPKCCMVCRSEIRSLEDKNSLGHYSKSVEETTKDDTSLFNETITIESILKEWCIKEDKDNLEKSSKYRCKCNKNKICAHCRVKAKCGGLLKICNSKEHASTCTSNENDPQEICEKILSGEKPYLPHLTKVLEKLKNDLSYRDRKQLRNRNKKVTDNIKKTSTDSEFSKNKNKLKCKKLDKLGYSEKELYDIRERSNIKTKLDFLKYMKKKYGHRYAYNANKNYPGVVLGHKNCLGYSPLVPCNMGWLWNAAIDNSRRGWRPGAIRKSIKDIMSHFLRDHLIDNCPVSSKYRGKKFDQQIVDTEREEELKQKPTLHVTKKNGEYRVTMNPLKDSEELKYSKNPYSNASPIRFKIIKDPILIRKKKIKEHIKKMGFAKCSCKQPLVKCLCRSFIEQNRIKSELDKVCKSLGVGDLKELITLSDSSESDSELDIEFTPPAGLIKPSLAKKCFYACKQTQYEEKDYNLTKPTEMRKDEILKKNMKNIKNYKLQKPAGDSPSKSGALKKPTQPGRRQGGGYDRLKSDEGDGVAQVAVSNRLTAGAGPGALIKNIKNDGASGDTNTMAGIQRGKITALEKSRKNTKFFTECGVAGQRGKDAITKTRNFIVF